MKIIPLSEGSFTIDHTKIFLPFEPAKDDLQQRSRGSLLVEIQPFLVETKKDLILLDTGLGFSEHGVLQLYNNLALHGYSPGDITMVQKIKSVLCSGTKSYRVWVPFIKPFPQKPPDPMAILLCFTL